MVKHGQNGMLITLFNHSMFLLILLLFCSQLAIAGSIVKFLPGFEGPLPFELETGYIGVDESEDVQLFYYFIKSESNPVKDPLVFWISGGPGCSGFSGLAYEIGPITFEKVDYHGNLPKLVLNPTLGQRQQILSFLDFPVGAGYSYGRTLKASHSIDVQACNQANEFLRKWLIAHPEFISNSFYVGGDSYSGIPVPVITQLISNGNDDGMEPKINLKGYVLGNPVTSLYDANYQVPFAHGMGLISDELYQSVKESCRGNYIFPDSSNTPCSKNMQKLNQLLSGIEFANILEPRCHNTPKSNNLLGDRRSLYQDFRKREQVSALKCRTDWWFLSNYWGNDASVQDALHVRKGTIREWHKCNTEVNLTVTIGDSRQYHANLSRKGYQSLIYSGDHDLYVPFMATQAWIRSLNYSIIDDWRQWIVDGQVGGYTRTYANQMTFATVKGGGHTAPEYKPQECKAMFERWISSRAL